MSRLRRIVVRIGAAYARLLEGRSERAITAYGLVTVALIATVDYLTGAELAFSFFYLVPILSAAWFGSEAAGLMAALAAGGAFPITEGLAGRGYAALWIPIWNFAVRSGTYTVVVALTGALKRSLRAERELARTDALTGLWAVRHFREAAEIELARATRRGEPVTVAFLDLDGFKSVNDDYGHAAGDELLQAVAEVLAGCTRPTDLVARVGGDEFVVLLSGSDESTAQAPLERVRSLIGDLASRAGYGISASIGAATFVSPPATVDELLWPADQLMYAAKRAGKNRIHQRTVAAAKPAVEEEA